eukprot:37658-Amphidinium_carterae.1
MMVALWRDYVARRFRILGAIRLRVMRRPGPVRSFEPSRSRNASPTRDGVATSALLERSGLKRRRPRVVGDRFSGTLSGCCTGLNGNPLDFYAIGKLIGRGAFGKVNIGVHKLTEEATQPHVHSARCPMHM